MSASGEAVVAWSFLTRSGLYRELWAAVAAPGAAFGAPVRIGEVQLGSPFSLAVGEGGHALLAFATGVRAAGRRARPGRRLRCPPRRSAAARDRLAILPAAAVDAGGGALVAWQRASDWAVDAVVRPGPGAFGAPVTLSRPRGSRCPRGCRSSSTRSRRWTSRASTRAATESGPTTRPCHPRAVIAGGRALVTWAAPLGRDGVWSLAPRSATLALAGGAAETRAHGAGIRDADLVTPLLADGGVPAVLWRDNRDDEGDDRAARSRSKAPREREERAPRVEVRAAGRSACCAAARRSCCGSRARRPATCAPRPAPGWAARTGRSRSAARAAGSIRLDPSCARSPRCAAARCACACARARRTRARRRLSTFTVRLRRRPGPPLPRVVDAVARRDGDDVVVTWRTTRDADAERPVRVLPGPARLRRADAAGRAASARACATSGACARSRSGSRTRRCSTRAGRACGCAGEGRGARRRCCSRSPRAPRPRRSGSCRSAR